MIKAFIFDWGGVLEFVDTTGFSRELASKYSVSEERFIEAERKNRRGLDAGDIDEEQYFMNIEKELKIKLDRKESYKLLFSKYVRPNRPLLNYIKKLKKKGYKMFILSDNNPLFYEHMKKDTDFENIFDRIVLSFQENMMKPNREIFNKVRHGFKPDECIFVDDKQEHVAAAKEMGMKAIRYIDFQTFLGDVKKMGIRV